MAIEWAWFDRHAGAVEALAAVGMLVFTAVLVVVTRRQAQIAKRQADIADKQITLQQAMHRKEGPVLRLYFNGIQSHPEDAKNEMLWFMVSVGNEGRRDVRVTHLDLEVLDPKTEGYRTYTLHSDTKIHHGKDARGHYTPQFLTAWPETEGKSETGGVVKSHEGRSFYVAIPANGGYDEWRRVRLRVGTIGVEPATHEMDWRVWSLPSHH